MEDDLENNVFIALEAVYQHIRKSDRVRIFRRAKEFIEKAQEVEKQRQ